MIVIKRKVIILEGKIDMIKTCIDKFKIGNTIGLYEGMIQNVKKKGKVALTFWLLQTTMRKIKVLYRIAIINCMYYKLYSEYNSSSFLLLLLLLLKLYYNDNFIGCYFFFN